MPRSFYNILVLPLFYWLLLVPLASSINFHIPRFDPNANDIFYQGDATASVGEIEFNKLNYLCRVGWATYGERVRLWDSNTGKMSDFTSRFTVTIDTQGSSNSGHGVAFFLAPAGSQIPPNSAGGFLGLFNTTTSDSSTNQIVLVEFDTFPNPEWDPPVQHVGINKNSIASAVYSPWNASFHSGDPADVLITYNATSKNLSVSWSYKKTNNPKEKSSLSYQINLMEVLPEWVMVGFSAATGMYSERHTLHSWEFSSSLDIKETSGKNAKKTRIIIATSVSAAVLLAGILITFIILRRRKQILERNRRVALKVASITDDFERGAGPRRFTFEELVSATNNFSNERKLGEGGFGAVYRGYLADLDMAVAVKKISRGSRQGKREYITEVKIISQLRHRYLVQLVGWCHDKGEFLLVYEFMPNGSLDSHLFDKKTLLTWTSRYKIAQGLASAMLYLHEEWEQCVVHRDIKSSNVMLDLSFNVRKRREKERKRGEKGDDEDVETMVDLYCGNGSEKNASIRLFAELVGMEQNASDEEDGAEEPQMVAPISYVDSESTKGGIGIDLNITPAVDMVGSEEEGAGEEEDGGDHWDKEVDGDADPDVDDVPDDIDAEDVNNDEGINASSFPEYPEIVHSHGLAVTSDDDELFIGQRFSCKEECVYAIKRYSMKISVDYKVFVSTPTIYVGECWKAAEGYNWRYRVSYQKAWVAKQIAMEQLYGDYNLSYNELQGWIVAMRAYELEPHIFWQRMNRLESDMEGQTNTSFRQWLRTIEPWQWAQSFDEGFRYGHMTTNLVEGINAVLLKTRHLPIASVFSVTFYRSYGVDLRSRRCECKKFETLHYPCAHVVAACAKVNLDAEQYVDDVYTLERTLRVSENEFPVLPDLSTWEVPPLITFELLPDAGLQRNPRGRPQLSRIRNEMDIREKSDGKRCGICRLSGHSRKKCPNRNFHVGQSSGSGRN
ncbi:hypothetical protein GOBAR_DD07755 [Gossypium barbadense]|nr:hypothetical protein GOBAR_DD07755 [Gossypium barbadense]